MRRGFCVLSVLILTTLAAAQPDTLWTYAADPNFALTAGDILPTEDGGFVVPTQIMVNGVGRFALLKLDADGQVVWTRTYGEESGWSERILPLADQGFVVFGRLASTAYVVRTTGTGDTLWTRRFDSTVPVYELYGMVGTTDGGVVLSWLTIGTSGAYVVKLNSAGAIQWSGRHSQYLHEPGGRITIAPDGGFLLATTILAGDTAIGPQAIAVSRLDSHGQLLWSQVYPRGRCSAVMETVDGGWLLVGSGRMQFPNRTVVLVIKADAQGTELWRQRIDSGEDGGGLDVMPAESDFLVAGYDAHAFIIRLDSAGRPNWCQHYPRGIESGFWGMAPTPDGGYGLAGWTRTVPNTPFALYVARTAPDTAGAIEDHPALAHDFSLSAFPNPFNPTTSLQFDLPSAARVKLSIYNTVGQHVITLADRRLEAGSHSLTFNGSALPSGIYIARLDADSRVRTRKLLLLK